MSDDNQAVQDQKLEPQNPVAPLPSIPMQPESQPQPINDTVAPIPSSVYKKHGFPISFKSLSLVILFLLMGSVFVISQLSSQKGSLDLRSRASKKEGNVLKNGSFEQNLLNWKEIKKDKSDSISVVAESPTQGTKSVKLTNASGKELTLYRDVKVDSDTWYTVRVDGKTVGRDGGARVELLEYNLVNGSPQFAQASLSKRFFGTMMQTKGDIVRSGKSLLVNSKKNFFINQIFAAPPDDGCTRSNVDKCGPQGGCSSDLQKCEETSTNKFECKFSTSFCTIYFQGKGATPKFCKTDLKGECVLKEMCRSGGAYSVPKNGYSDCKDMNTHSCCAKASVIEPIEKPCSPGDAIKCGKEIPEFGADKCDKTRYGCVIDSVTGKYRWLEINTDNLCLNISPKCANPPGVGTPTPSVPPKSGCTSDDDCTKIKSDTYCEAGVCKDRPANCGTACYDPVEGDIPVDTIEARCSPLTCAPPQEGGKRYCWGDGCGGGGVEQKPAEKYLRITLALDNKGTAYFDNVRFTKGQDNAAPKITSSAPTIATVGAQLNYQVIATDENRDALTFGLGSLPCPFNDKNCKKEKVVIPKNAAISPTGLFTFTPEASGTANIRLWVFDGMKPTKQELNLTIN